MSLPIKKENQDDHDFLDKVYDDAYLLNISVKYIAPLIQKYLTKNPELKGQLIDIGCGNGSILKYLRDSFQNRFHYSGIDFFENSDSDTQNPITFLKDDLNKDFSQSIKGKFDIVISCEVIEHVVDTDHFITHVKECLKPGGILILTTPNLSSFFNRILLLFGYQPLHTEVSWQNPYIGRESLYKIIGQDKAPAAGHLSLFTAYALKKFLEYHGFDVIKKNGTFNLRRHHRFGESLLYIYSQSHAHTIYSCSEKILTKYLDLAQDSNLGIWKGYTELLTNQCLLSSYLADHQQCLHQFH